MRSLVHRIQLEFGSTIVELPRWATIIHAAWKAGEPRPSLWYVFDVDEATDRKRWRFELIATGQELVTNGITYVRPMGSFVAPDGHDFHVFEVEP